MVHESLLKTRMSDKSCFVEPRLPSRLGREGWQVSTGVSYELWGYTPDFLLNKCLLCAAKRTSSLFCCSHFICKFWCFCEICYQQCYRCCHCCRRRRRWGR